MPGNDEGIEIDNDDAARSEEKNDEELKEQEENLQANLTAAARQSMVATSDAAMSIAINVEQLEDLEDIELAQMAPAGPEPHDNVPGDDPQLAQYRMIIREELMRMRDGSVLSSYTVRWALASLAVVGGINAIHAIYAWMKAPTGSSGARFMTADAAQLSGDLPAAAIVRAAWLVDEPTFWKRFADYAAKTGTRPYPEQLLFMKFTEDLSAGMLPQMFDWDSAADKLQMITQLLTQITSKGLAAAYLTVPTLRYKSEPLPRSVSANVMALTLGAWAFQQKPANV